MLESVLRVLFRDEEALSDEVRDAAVANWMKLFHGRWRKLQQLVDDYPVRCNERCCVTAALTIERTEPRAQKCIDAQHSVQAGQSVAKRAV